MSVEKAVVDTDVVSYLLKHDTRAAWYLPHLAGRTLLLSFMTVAELDRWVIARGWGEDRRDALEAHLRQYLIYPFNRELCRAWAAVSESARKHGRPITCGDAWIAATAVLHQVPLITHNAAHYSGVDGLQLISMPPAAGE